MKYTNWRIQRGPEIRTDHTPIMLTLSTNPIKIKTAARDNYNLADWQIFQIHTSEQKMWYSMKKEHRKLVKLQGS